MDETLKGIYGISIETEYRDLIFSKTLMIVSVALVWSSFIEKELWSFMEIYKISSTSQLYLIEYVYFMMI